MLSQRPVVQVMSPSLPFLGDDLITIWPMSAVDAHSSTNVNSARQLIRIPTQACLQSRYALPYQDRLHSIVGTH